MTDMIVALTLRAFDQLSPVVGKAAQNMSRAFQGFGGLQLVGAALGNLGQQLARVGESARGLSLGLGLGGIGAAFVGKQFISGIIETSAQFENFAAVLEVTEGSAEKARASLNWVQAFATQTPYELAEVSEAFVALRAYGLEPTNGLLQTLGDTASAMNKPIMQAVEAIADAVTGENERLKEFGIKASTQGGKITYTWTQNGRTMQRSVDASNQAMITSTLEAIMNSRYAGAMAKRAATWDGMVSNLSDTWTNFKKSVGAAGVFSALKGILQDTQQGLASNSSALTEFATGLGGELARGINDAYAAFRGLVGGADGMAAFGQSIGRGVVETLREIGGALRWTGSQLLAVHDYFDSWRPVLIGVGLIITGPLIASLGALVASFATLSVALASNPFGLVAIGIGAAVAAGVLLYQNWDTVTAKLGAAWDTLRERFRALATFLGAPGAIITTAQAIADNWDAIASRIRGVWEGLIAAWDAVRQRLSAAWGAVQSAIGGSAAPAITPAIPGGAAAARQQVGGEIAVQISGAPRGSQVTGIRSRGGIDLTAEMGPYAPR